MAQEFTDPAKVIMLDALTLATKIKLHTANPTIAGNTNYVTGTGGTGVNATFAGAAGTPVKRVLSGAVNFTGGASNGPVTYFSVWNTALTVCYGVSAIESGDQTFNAAGEYTLSTATALQLSDP